MRLLRLRPLPLPRLHLLHLTDSVALRATGLGNVPIVLILTLFLPKESGRDCAVSLRAAQQQPTSLSRYDSFLGRRRGQEQIVLRPTSSCQPTCKLPVAQGAEPEQLRVVAFSR